MKDLFAIDASTYKLASVVTVPNGLKVCRAMTDFYVEQFSLLVLAISLQFIDLCGNGV